IFITALNLGSIKLTINRLLNAITHCSSHTRVRKKDGNFPYGLPLPYYLKPIVENPLGRLYFQNFPAPLPIKSILHFHYTLPKTGFEYLFCLFEGCIINL